MDEDDEKITAQQVVARITSRTPPQRGSTSIRLNGWTRSHIHVFSTASGDLPLLR